MPYSPDINIQSGIVQLMNTSTATTTQQILLIDSQVQDLDQLIAGVQPNTAVYVLHPQENGIAQITTILQQHAAIETVYLVAHGQPGCLYLGNTIFNQETLPTVSELLKNWNIGQLLIYACNLANGETGETFLHSLHHYTKAKIAASSHPIGQTEFGQNWQLNQTTHPIEIKSVFNPEVMATYSGVLAAGDLDTTFSGDGIVTTDLGSGTQDNGNVMALQPDGKIIVAGTSNDDIALVLYNSNGSLDTTFSGDGKLTTDLGGKEFGNSMVLQPDGKIVVVGGGTGFDIAVVRYNSNGSLDTTFSGDGKLTTDLGGYESGESVALQSDGKIIVGGSNQLLRYNSNGTLDTTFGENGIKTLPVNSEVDGYNGISIAVQADGKIVVAGGTFFDFAVVARLNSNGSLDTTFSDDGIVTTDLGDDFEWASDLVLQPDGKIVLAGNRGDASGYHPADFAVVRYNSNGSLDTTFSGDGKVTTDLGSWYDFGQSVELQPDGKIVVAGDSGNDFAVVRYLNDSASGTIKGTANNDILTGTANPETINGLGGNDKLSGKGGNDTLIGGPGVDKFIYNTNAAFTTSAVGVDTITDFSMVQGDKIVLDKTTFPKISSVAGTGFSINSEFAKVTSDALAATRAADIVYNSTTGGLFYNQNGTAAGLGTGGKFLTLTNKPVLTENQFLIQA